MGDYDASGSLRSRVGRRPCSRLRSGQGRARAVPALRAFLPSPQLLSSSHTTTTGSGFDSSDDMFGHLPGERCPLLGAEHRRQTHLGFRKSLYRDQHDCRVARRRPTASLGASVLRATEEPLLAEPGGLMPAGCSAHAAIIRRWLPLSRVALLERKLCVRSVANVSP